MSLSLLNRAFALAAPSAPTYLSVKEERARRRRASAVFAIALIGAVLGRVVFGAIEVHPAPEPGCVARAGEHPSACDGPFAGSDGAVDGGGRRSALLTLVNPSG